MEGGSRYKEKMRTFSVSVGRMWKIVCVLVCLGGVAWGDKYEEFKKAVEAGSGAGDALDGVYSECFAQVSFTCLQKKVLGFVGRLSRAEKFSLLGRYVEVVRVGEGEDELGFQSRVARAENDNTLDDMVESSIDGFFNSHIIRIRVPQTFAVLKSGEGRSNDDVTALDFRFPYSQSEAVEGRKKGGGGGGKMGKKMMMMMMMGMKAKLMMLGPLMMGLAGLMAMKALIAGVISLTISKIMILKKLLKNKGGGGGHGGGGWESSGGGGSSGWSSGGGGGGGHGGGWDRRSDSTWDPADLAYRAYSTVESLL